MTENLLSEFIHHLDPENEMRLENAPQKIQNWLEELGLPIDLLRFLQWNWPQREGQIAHLALMPSVKIYHDEFAKQLLPHKFLQIGSAPNGDLLVIDFSDEKCPIGFITHEEIWEHEDDPRQVYQQIATSMASLLYRIIEGKYLPIDYYAAKDFNDILATEEGTA